MSGHQFASRERPCEKVEFMRASTLWQRNLAGRFSLGKVPISHRFPLIIRSQTSASNYARSIHIESKAEAELTELFKRVPWPTTPREERALVESVRAVIWEGQNGGMLNGVRVVQSAPAANQGSRQALDKRKRAEEREAAKRRKLENGEEVVNPIYATEFSKEEIENEERRPKKKVAVMIGYSGTGYYGMQLYVKGALR